MDFLSKYTGQRIEELLEQGSATPPLKVIDIQGVFGTVESPSTLSDEKYEELLSAAGSGLVVFKDGVSYYPITTFQNNDTRMLFFCVYGGTMGSSSHLMWDTWFVDKEDKSCYYLSGGIAPETDGDGLCFLSNKFYGQSNYGRLIADISEIVQSEETSGTSPSDLFNYFDLYNPGTIPALFAINKDSHGVLTLATGIIHIDSVLVSVEIPYYFYGTPMDHQYFPKTCSLRHLQVNFTGEDTWTKKEVVKEVRLAHFNLTNGMSNEAIIVELSANMNNSSSMFAWDVFHEIFHCILDGGRITVIQDGLTMYPVYARTTGTDTSGSVILTFIDPSGQGVSLRTYDLHCEPDGYTHGFSVSVS